MKIRRYSQKSISESSNSPMKTKKSHSKKRPRDCTCNCCVAVQKEIVAIREKQNVMQAQMKMLVEAMAEQKVLLKRFVQNQSQEIPLRNKFPLINEDQLQSLNGEITQENRLSYINAMTSIIKPQGIAKNLKYILSTELIIQYNVDGIHGKKSLKSFGNFYNAILESIPIVENSGAADVQLRRAIMLQKKRHFKKICIDKKNETKL